MAKKKKMPAKKNPPCKVYPFGKHYSPSYLLNSVYEKIDNIKAVAVITFTKDGQIQTGFSDVSDFTLLAMIGILQLDVNTKVRGE